MATELGHEPDTDEATRAGSLALLIYSCGKQDLASLSLGP
jgi:solute carrier family 45 protein 1/2/4